MSERICAGLALVLLLAASATPTAREGMRDPLRPPGWRATAEPAQAPAPAFDADAWQLASTLVSGARRSAIINGRNVRPGDTVGGAEVLAIEPGRAVLDYDGRRFTIRRTTPTVRYREHRGGSSQ